MFHRRARLNAAMRVIAKKNRLATVVVDSPVAPAWGTINFSANPSVADSVTINGVSVTIDPDLGTHGATLALTLAGIVAYVLANPITGVGSVTESGDSLLVQSAGPADTAITLAVSSAVGSVSSATLQAQKIRRREALSNETVTP